MVKVMQGRVFNIQRFSIHDGPGIRTSVFLKGCNLDCLWCHNPESNSVKQEIQYFSQKCALCETCIQVCPTGAHFVNEQGVKVFDRHACDLCGLCVENCLYDALVFVYQLMEPDEVLDVVMRDFDYYRNSGGGLTISGGEPLLQKDFVRAVFSGAKARGVHTALDTAANIPWTTIAEVLPVVDLVLLDLKAMDEEVHRKGTGVSNQRILQNAQSLSEYPVDLIVRIPVIPGINATEDNMRRTAEFLQPFRRLFYVELLPYHDLGVDKHLSLGRTGETATFENPNEIMAPTDHMSQEIETTSYNLEVTYDDPNYLTVGGLLSGDRPSVNELSYLFVEAAHEMKLRNPFIVVRYYPTMDPQFWLKVCDALRANANLVIYNDSTMIPALRSYGVDEEDAYNYGFYGCNDPNLPMKEGGLRQLWFNLLRPLELALHSGEYPLKPNGKAPHQGPQYALDNRMIGLMTGPYYGLKTPGPDEIHDIGALLEAYRQQVRFLLEDYRRAVEQDFELELQVNAGRIRIEDCFLHGTIENATTWNNGGTKYHKITIQGSGMASVVDSLAAVEQLVFRNKELSLEELVEVLRKDFEGHETLRLKLGKKMAKFGNDIDWVDDLARRVVDIFCDEVAQVNRPEYVYTFFPCISTDRDFTTMGLDVGATPDGRCAGQQIS